MAFNTDQGRLMPLPRMVDSSLHDGAGGRHWRNKPRTPLFFNFRFNACNRVRFPLWFGFVFFSSTFWPPVAARPPPPKAVQTGTNRHVTGRPPKFAQKRNKIVFSFGSLFDSHVLRQPTQWLGWRSTLWCQIRRLSVLIRKWRTKL